MGDGRIRSLRRRRTEGMGRGGAEGAGGGRTATTQRSGEKNKRGGRTMRTGRRREEVAASKCTRKKVVDGTGRAATERTDGGGQGRGEFDPEWKAE